MCDSGLDRHRQTIFLIDPSHKLRHERGHVFGFGRHVNDGLGARVPNDVLAVSIRRRFNACRAASHHQRVQPLHRGLRNLLTFLCPSLDFIKSCVVRFDFGLVSFAPRKVPVAADHFGYLLLREPIAFDDGRIVRRK